MADRLDRTVFPREERLALGLLVALALITAGWWALALWPVPGAAPAWLARARVVCFGIVDSGLPDPAGWVGLVGQPLGMLGVLLFGWGGALARGVRRLERHPLGRRLRTAFVLAVAAGVGAAAFRVAGAMPGSPAAVSPAERPGFTHPRLDREAPALRLVDQHGATLDLAEIRGRPALLTFAYAHCADICPLLVKDVLSAQAALAHLPPERRPRVLVVTLDPWRDTPARLPHIAKSWGMGADAHLLGGEVEAVTAVLDAWDVPYRRDESTGQLAHPRLVYVLDGGGRIAYAATGGPAVLARLVEELR